MTTMEKRDAQTSDRTVRSQVLDFTREDGEDDGELYTFPLSSETPYRRWRGNEILVHTKDAVDLAFLNSGTAPLLHQHNQWSGQIGVITKAWLDEGKKRVYVTVRFSRRPEAQAVKQDVDDGIMRNVSVGYNVLQIEHTERDDDAPSEYRVTSWKPMEASIVSIPADETVGVGRATQTQEGVMPAENTQEAGATPNGTETRATGGLPSAVPTNVMSDEARAAERQAQSDEIMALARSHNMADLGNDFIRTALLANETPSLAAFRGRLRSELPDDVPLVNNDVGLGRDETQRFSIVRLARCMADSATGADETAARFEIEACEAAARNFEGDTNGYRLPEEVMRSWNDFEVDGVRMSQVRAPMTTGGNPNVQDTDHLAGRFIDNLRNMSSVLRAGVTVLPGLSGNIEIPGGDTNSALGWLGAEGDDAPETTPTFRKITMDIKDAAAHTKLTRRMLMQSTIAIEAYVRNQLLVAMALGIDLAGLQGSGASGVPTGLKNTTGIGSVTFAAANPTRGEIIDLRTDVATGNALLGNLHYISNSAMVGHFLKTPVDPGSGRFLMDKAGDGLVGHSHIESNQVADGDLFFGNFADLLMGMWGGLDLDRETKGDNFLSGGLTLRAIQSVDFGVSRVGSFSLGNDG